MNRWFGEQYDLQILGFEASGEHFGDAQAALKEFDNVRLFHVALVGPGHVGGDVRLYKAGGEGKGDSLFAARGENYELTSARRLSELLVHEGLPLGTGPVLLRMNIEGAEEFVINDLVEAGLQSSVDGYYGMWDDLAKLDPGADKVFRQLTRRSRIFPLTFNDRDLPYRLRRYAIRIDMETSIRRGLARRARI
jgi:hypothetical protein